MEVRSLNNTYLIQFLLQQNNFKERTTRTDIAPPFFKRCQPHKINSWATEDSHSCNQFKFKPIVGICPGMKFEGYWVVCKSPQIFPGKTNQATQETMRPEISTLTILPLHTHT